MIKFQDASELIQRHMLEFNLVITFGFCCKTEGTVQITGVGDDYVPHLCYSLQLVLYIFNQLTRGSEQIIVQLFLAKFKSKFRFEINNNPDEVDGIDAKQQQVVIKLQGLLFAKLQISFKNR